MKSDMEFEGRFLGVIDVLGSQPVDGLQEAELVRPSRTIIFDDFALVHPRCDRQFVVYFKPETNLPPVAVRGTGVDLLGPGYGIWTGDPAAKTFVPVFRIEDVVRIVPQVSAGHSTAT